MTAVKDLFVDEVSKQWENLRSREDTIFENISYSLDPEIHYENLAEKNPELRMALFQENSIYEKKKMIQSYFWDTIVGELYESTLAIMKHEGLLEEALRSFEKSYKIERTAELILENGIFANLPNTKKKELTESLIQMCFYPASFNEKHASILTEGSLLEESSFSNAIQALGRSGVWLGDRIRDLARFSKSIYILLLYLLVTPATILVATPSAYLRDKIMDAYNGSSPKGLNPSLRKMMDYLEDFSPIKFLFKFMNQDLYEVADVVRKTNLMDDEYLKDILKEMNSNQFKIIKKCWDRNKHQIIPRGPDESKIWKLIKDIFSGRGLANAVRNPIFRNEMQLALLLKEDAANPTYQKMFFEFRVCVYEKFFEIINGYAKTIYSMDDASYEIIKAANEAHKRKNFKAFFDLKPKQVNEEAMFKIMRALVSIDVLATALEKRKGELVADKYIDRFVEFLRANVKQTYKELDELANQRKYNLDRYQEENPTEEEKAEAIRKQRFEAKKSIFDED